MSTANRLLRLSLSFFISHKLAMKVTASEVFKGKKANYTSSIPKPFMPHRLGEKCLDNAAVCVQCVIFL